MKSLACYRLLVNLRALRERDVTTAMERFAAESWPRIAEQTVLMIGKLETRSGRAA